MNERAKLARIIVKTLESFPKVHKFLTSGDTGCHPQHLVDTIVENVLEECRLLSPIQLNDIIISLEWMLNKQQFECDCEPLYEYDANATTHSDDCALSMRDHIEATLNELKKVAA